MRCGFPATAPTILSLAARSTGLPISDCVRRSAALVPRLEAHLFDIDVDLYGRHLRVALIDFIRPERKFAGLDQLKAQISEDAARARAIARSLFRASSNAAANGAFID